MKRRCQGTGKLELHQLTHWQSRETTKEGLQGQAQFLTKEESCIGREVRQRELPEKELRRRRGKKRLQKMKLLQPGQQRKRKKAAEDEAAAARTAEEEKKKSRR